jgi:cell division protein FtsL
MSLKITKEAVALNYAQQGSYKKMTMKVKTTKIGKNRNASAKIKPKAKSAEWQSVFVDFSKFLIVIMVAVALIGSYAYISSGIQKTANENFKLEREINNLNKEIENHQAKIESLKSAEHINKQIARFGMDLRLPQGRQRYEITLQVRGNETITLQTANNNKDKSQNTASREVALK